MFRDEMSDFFSDDGTRTAKIILSGSFYKVVFSDSIAKLTYFKFFKSIESAEWAAEDFVLYESS